MCHFINNIIEFICFIGLNNEIQVNFQRESTEKCDTSSMRTIRRLVAKVEEIEANPIKVKVSRELKRRRSRESHTESYIEEIERMKDLWNKKSN